MTSETGIKRQNEKAKEINKGQLLPGFFSGFIYRPTHPNRIQPNDTQVFCSTGAPKPTDFVFSGVTGGYGEGGGQVC